MRLASLMFRIRLLLTEKGTDLLRAAMMIAMMVVGIAGLFVISQKREMPMVDEEVYVSECEISRGSLIAKSRVQECVRTVVLRRPADITTGSNRVIQTGPIPDAVQYLVLEDVKKGDPISGREFLPYIPTDQPFVLLQADAPVRRADEIRVHIRDNDLIRQLSRLTGISGSVGEVEGGLQLTPQTDLFQVEIRGKCAAVMEDGRCAFVITAADLVDLNGRTVVSVSVRNAYAIIEKMSGVGIYAVSGVGGEAPASPIQPQIPSNQQPPGGLSPNIGGGEQ